MGKLWTTGRGTQYATGLNTTNSRNTLGQNGSDTDWEDTGTNPQGGNAIKSGVLYTWGRNLGHWTGRGTSSGETRVPSIAGSGNGWTLSDEMCAIKNGSIYAWATNSHGTTGQGTTSGTSTTPLIIGAKTDWVDVKINFQLAVGLDSSGRLWTWGNNGGYRTGRGTNTGIASSPVQVGSDTNWAEIGCHAEGGFAIKNNGTLWSWGTAGLGNITAQGASSVTQNPTQIGSDTDWQKITGMSCVLAIKAGQLWTWGVNSNYVTGLGSNTGFTPYKTLLDSATTWTEIVTKDYFSGGIKAGQLWTWGNNIDGVTGQGTSSGQTTTPTRVGSKSNWTNLSCNGFTTFVIESTGPPPVAPVLSSVTHFGTEINGSTLTANYTESTGSPTPTPTYKWQRNDSGWSDISGATASTYTLTSDDVSFTVRVKVTVTNASGSDNSYSTASSVITSPPINGTVSISGTANVGEELTASAIIVGFPTPSKTWQWENTSGAISGATTNTYTVQESDRGKEIRVELISTNSEGTDTDYSAWTSTIPRAPNITAVSISGTMIKSEILTAVINESAGIPVPTKTYQWQRESSGWSDIGGATSANYTTVNTDVGKSLRVIVVATNSEGSSSKTSSETSLIAELPTITTLTISGIPKMGEILTSTFIVDGFPTPSKEKQWQRNDSGWSDISGATASTYTLTSDDVSHLLRLKGTAENIHSSVTDYSSATTEVLREPEINSFSIIGEAYVSNSLTSSSVIKGHPVPTKTYQWQYFRSSGWTNISGATASNFTITWAELGFRLRLKLTATNSEGVDTAYSIRTEIVVPADTAPDINVPIISGLTQSGQTLTASASDLAGYPEAVFTWQWERYVGASWVTISEATSRLYILKKADVNYTIRVKATATNSSGSDSEYSAATVAIIEAVGTDLYRVYVHDWEGNMLGELTDAKNLNTQFGLSKNFTASFDTTLNSLMGLEIADNDYTVITIWRWNPYTEAWFLFFSGPVLTKEENGNDNIPTIGLTAVGGYWQLSKRVADDSTGSGRRQNGMAPATSELYAVLVDRVGNRILIYNTKDSSFINALGSFGSGNGQFDNPRGVAVSQSGFIYVADTGNNRIQKFTSNGTYLAKWGSYGTGNINFDSPRDVTIDPSGDVWVTDKGNKRVMKFDANGNYILKVSTTGSYTMNEIEGISSDSDGFIYVGDIETGAGAKGRYKINSQGVILSSSTGSQRKFIKSNDGQFFWTNTANEAYKSGRNGSKNSKINSSGNAKSIQVSDDGAIYVLEDDNASVSRVRKYSANGTLSRTFGAYGSGTGESRGAVGFALLRAGSRDGIEIVEELINDNITIDGNHWVRAADIIGTSEKVFIQPGSWGGFKKISDAIDSLSGGFEWKVTPKLFTDTDGIVLSEFYADQTVGDNKTGSVNFQYGVGQNNANSYSIKTSIDAITTRASYPAADSKPYNLTVNDSDTISQIGVFEEIADGSLIDKNLRKRLLNLFLRIRKIPRVLVSITPARSDQSGPNNLRVPIPLIDYNVGDIVGITIQDDGRNRLSNAEARVYDISITVDESGKEQAEIGLYID